MKAFLYYIKQHRFSCFIPKKDERHLKKRKYQQKDRQ